MKRPNIKSTCVADQYHGQGERIVEVTFPDGSGCLISLGSYPANTIEVYRADAGIKVVACKPTVEHAK